MKIKKFSKRVTAIALSSAVLLTAAFFSVPAVAENVLNRLTSSNVRTVTVNKNDVVQEDFNGFGTNFCPAGRYVNNMTDAYYQVNYKRIKAFAPSIVRYWVHPSWLMNNENEEAEEIKRKWEAHDYNTSYYWEDDDLQLFFEYCKLLKETGTEVQLDMNGEQRTKVTDWYGIKDATFQGGASTLPADLESFGYAIANLIKYAYEEKGLTNITTVAFFNEVNGGSGAVFGDKRVYWVRMLKEVHNALKATTVNIDGVDTPLRDIIEINGTEIAHDGGMENAEYWYDYIMENAKDENGEKYYDYLSNHYYPGDRTLQEINEITSNLINYVDSPFYMMEFGSGYGSQESQLGYERYTWEFGNSVASNVAVMANNGINGMAEWFLCGTTMDISIGGAGWNYPSYREMWVLNWDIPSPEDGESRMADVTNLFSENSLLYRFIPQKGKTLKTTISGKYDFSKYEEGDTVAASFVSEDGNDATVIMVVSDSDTDRTLDLKLNGFNGKEFNKYVYEYAFEYGATNGNVSALMPEKQASFTVSNNTVTDTLPNKHSLVVYTTYDEFAQVEIDNSVSETLEFEISAAQLSQGVALDVAEVHGTNEQGVTWKVLTTNSTDDKNARFVEFDKTKGDFTQDPTDRNKVTYYPQNVQVGDTIAVAAISNTDEGLTKLNVPIEHYDVAIVKIVE